MNYYLFVNSLKSYNHLIKERDLLKEKIEIEWYDLAGVKGVDFSKESIHNQNELLRNINVLERLDHIEELENELKNIIYQINKIEKRLNEMDDIIQYIFVEKYINKKSFERLSKELHISIGGLQSKMKSEFNKGA